MCVCFSALRQLAQVTPPVLWHIPVSPCFLGIAVRFFPELISRHDPVITTNVSNKSVKNSVI